VVDQYEAVKESVTETFDWRAQVGKHPLAWGVGAFSEGFVVSYVYGERLRKTKTYKRLGAEVDELRDQLVKTVSDLRDNFTSDLSKIGQGLVPGIAQTALPMVAGKVKDFTGLDLSRQLGVKARSKNNKKKNKAKGKKNVS
jgi:hypothetical protein